MKPGLRIEEFWTALVTAISSIVTVLLADVAQRPDLAAVIVPTWRARHGAHRRVWPRRPGQGGRGVGAGGGRR